MTPTTAVESDTRSPAERAIGETAERIQMAINREENSIRQNEALRSSTGLFGKFHRALTLSDPYEIEIRNSRQVIGIMNFARQFLDQAARETSAERKADLINQARRHLGMREINADFTDAGRAPVTGRKTVAGTEHFDVEQEAIDVSRDVALETGITAATMGTGSVANLGRKGAEAAGKQAVKAGLKYVARKGATEGATMGGLFSASTSSGRNIDEVVSKGKDIGDAVQDVAKDTAKGTAAGAVLGAGISTGSELTGRGIGAIRGRATRTAGETRTQAGPEAPKMETPGTGKTAGAPEADAPTPPKSPGAKQTETAKGEPAREASPKPETGQTGARPAGRETMGSPREQVSDKPLEFPKKQPGEPNDVYRERLLDFARRAQERIPTQAELRKIIKWRGQNETPREYALRLQEKIDELLELSETLKQVPDQAAADLADDAARALDQLLEPFEKVKVEVYPHPQIDISTPLERGNPASMQAARKILGVKPGADSRSLMEAYRSLSQKYHPDHNAPYFKAKAETDFRRIKDAFDLLLATAA